MAVLLETYIDSLTALFAGNADLQALGVTVHESVDDAFDASEPRALVVDCGAVPALDPSTIGRTTRAIELALIAVVRGNPPRRAASAVFEITHPLVLAFDAPGVLGVTEVGRDRPDVIGAENGIGVITMRYAIQYQSAPDAL